VSKDQTWIVGTIVSVVLGALLAVAGSSGSARAGSLAVFAVCVAVAYIINWVVFVPSFAARTEKYFDLTGSITYISVTVLALLLSSDVDLRAVLAAAMVAVWALRLGSFLFARIRRDGKDGRFDTMKHDFLQFLMTWTIQGLWVSLTLAAALAIITSSDRQDFGVLGVIGFLVWLIGFAIEVISDQQKSAFKADPANDGRFITSGLWSWSRHPNYFGEITLWTGMAIMAIPVLSGWRWVVLISPIFVFLLLTRISGLPMLERRAQKRWGDEPEFQAYTKATSVLVPLPPRTP
jgi:steroid 5-alpha reductase family enzyme